MNEYHKVNARSLVYFLKIENYARAFLSMVRESVFWTPWNFPNLVIFEQDAADDIAISRIGISIAISCFYTLAISKIQSSSQLLS